MRFHSLGVLLDCPQVSVEGEVAYHAPWIGRADIMALLLDRRGEELRFSKDALNAATRNSEMLRLLLDRRGCDVEITNDLLNYAVEGSLLLLQQRLSNGTATQANNRLLILAANGFLRACTVILRTNKPDVDTRGTLGDTAFFRAAANGHLEFTTILLKYVANPHLQKHNWEEPDLNCY